MKTANWFLVLPLAATIGNALLAFWLLSLPKPTQQQLPVIHDNAVLVELCASGGGTGKDCAWSMDRYLNHAVVPIGSDEHIEDDFELLNVDDGEEEDPMLQVMPGNNFKAYVRADIATFYREEAGSRQEKRPSFQGQAGKFVNQSPETLALYWEGPQGLVLNSARIKPWASGGTACFPGHTFVFTNANDPEDIVCRMKVVQGISTYYCDPFRDNDPNDLSLAVRPSSGTTRSLISLSMSDRKHYDGLTYNRAFADLYKNFTGGSEWLSQYPRDSPMHKMWRADYFGQSHTIQTKETQFFAMPPEGTMHTLKKLEMKRSKSRTIAYPEYRAPGAMNLTITALSCAPRVFEIQHFLSDVEVDHLLQVAVSKNLERSTTNGHLSDTRTSRTTWIPRNTDPVLDAIFRRGADVLRMDEAMFRERFAGEVPQVPHTRSINEDLQIVHYDEGQQYTAHHDFGYPSIEPNSPSRSINLCMYLNDVPIGGETSFPRWRNAESSEAIHVKPQKGKAVIFYMVNPDGNLDDLTQHAALPVIQGEKYFANLWIWDPMRI